MFCLSWTATRSVTKCHGIDSRRVEGASSRNCNRLYVVTVMHTMPCSFQIIQYLFKYLQILSWLKWETQLWWKRLLLFSWINLKEHLTFILLGFIIPKIMCRLLCTSTGFTWIVSFSTERRRRVSNVCNPEGKLNSKRLHERRSHVLASPLTAKKVEKLFPI